MSTEAIPTMPSSGEIAKPGNRSAAFGAFLALAGGLAIAMAWPTVLWLMAPRQPRDSVFRVCAALWAGFGLTQLVYVVPIYFWACSKGMSGFSRGFRMGSVAVLIVNLSLVAFFVLWPFPMLK